METNKRMLQRDREEKRLVWLQQNILLEQNLTLGETTITSIIEQAIKTRAQRQVSGLTENGADCVRNNERLQRLLAGCRILASSEYLARQQSACGDGCCMGKMRKSVTSECEMVSRKVEQGMGFRELSGKANMRL